MSAATAVDEDDAVTTTAVGCAASAPDEAAAAAMAIRCGHEVEIEDARAADSRLFATSTGDLRLESTSVEQVPALTGWRDSWTSVRDRGRPTFRFQAPQGVGRCSRAIDAVCPPGGYRGRLMWHFALGSLRYIDPSRMTSAELRVEGTFSASCVPSAVTAYRVGDFDQTTTWPGGPWTAARALSTRTVAHRPGCGPGNEPRTVSFDVLKAARYLAVVKQSTVSLGLKADDEATGRAWKRYARTATLSIEINRAPHTPTAETLEPFSTCVTGAERPFVTTVGNTQTRLVARLADPDGDHLVGHFRLFRLTDQEPLVEVTTWPKPSGTHHEVHLADGLLSHGETYRWDVQARDPEGALGPLRSCEFTVDSVAPEAPVITAVEDAPAVYLGGVSAGGIGVPGAFRLTSASEDVVRFKVDDATGPPQVLRGRDVVHSFVPKREGSHELEVYAVDRAGNVSTIVSHWIAVAFAPFAGVWNLDEGAGSVSADRVGGNDLVVPDGVDWVPGVIFVDPDDLALQFDGSDAAAATASALSTDGSFTVVADVRADGLADAATAVSIGGGEGATAELGLRAGTGCPTTDPCWTFTVRPGGASAATPAVASSVRPAVAGSWVMLVGTYDAHAGTIRMATCVQEGFLQNDWGEAVSLPDDVRAARSGVLRVGGADGRPQESWRGAVSHVRVYGGLIEEGRVRDACATPSWSPPLPLAP